jgi:two-component system cell cycle sensor histidine kinase PleC
MRDTRGDVWRDWAAALAPAGAGAVAAVAGCLALQTAGTTAWAAGALAVAAAGSLVYTVDRAQAAKRAQRTRLDQLERIADASTDWAWEMDRDLRFSYLGPKFGAAFGVAPESCLGKRRVDLFDPDNDPERITAHLADLKAHRPFRDFTFVSRDVRGRRLWLRVSGVPVFDARGRFSGYRGVASDDTAQQEAEAAATAAQRRLVHLTDSIPGAVYQLEGDETGYRIVFVSAGIESLFGIPSAKARDFEHLFAQVHPDDRPRIVEVLNDAYVGERNFFMEYRIEVAGAIKWIRAQAVARRLRAGAVLWNGLLTDVTELKSTEAKLREQQDRYERAVRGSQDGLWDYDVATDQMYYSPRCYELLALDPDALGASAAAFHALVDRRDQARLRALIADHVKQGAPYDIELRMTTGPGATRWFRLRAETERDADGRAIRIAGTLSDIDQLKTQERELIAAREKAELANKSKTEFLANMSHELRTPLNAVIGFAEVLEGELLGELGNPRYRAYASDIRESGQHLLSLINDILDHAKIEAGRRELHEEWLDLADVIPATVRLVRERADERQVTLKVEPADRAPRVLADLRGLKQILLNLLSNALKFTHAGGRVTVRAGADEGGAGVGGAWLEVADTGIGIAPEDIEKALAPFGQADNWLTREHEGTGLGLALCRQLAELHAGRLDLDSTPGEGTTVRVTLPPERIAGEGADQVPARAHDRLTAANG